MNRGRTGILAAFLLMAAVAVAVLLSSYGSGDGSVPVRKDVLLNEFLTNDISDTSSLHGLDSRIENYMRQWAIRGASLAIMRGDSLLYAKGYGWADEEAGVRMEPFHVMRVASVSKLLTATGIMMLQERGLLSLEDTVFGEHGILNDTAYASVIRDPAYRKITVEHLLRHQGGFTQYGGDPMFSTRNLMISNHLDTVPDHRTLMRIQLKRRLGFAPGTSQAYSNFGYLLLSKVMEKVTGLDYGTFMRDSVLRPAGCVDMHIAGNYYEDRLPNEVRYYNGADTCLVDEYSNSGRMVDRCYGGNDIRALSGAGAWVASPAELARFVASIDGRPEVPDIISPESVAAMTAWFDEKTYSLGWNDTKPTGEWTRTGTFSGTSALIKYYPDGECWIMVTNTSTWKGPGFTRHTARLFQSLREQYSPMLPSRDFFHAETVFDSGQDTRT